ncbi:hypothetical protein R1flu_016260 [Riccia fluitans]|uniref:Uncharacterized protein n=1 Tax=Riccia fluitans TaxID=41844 RepID=A0ABD1YMD2_9MARC
MRMLVSCGMSESGKAGERLSGRHRPGSPRSETGPRPLRQFGLGFGYIPLQTAHAPLMGCWQDRGGIDRWPTRCGPPKSTVLTGVPGWPSCDSQADWQGDKSRFGSLPPEAAAELGKIALGHVKFLSGGAERWPIRDWHWWGLVSAGTAFKTQADPQVDRRANSRDRSAIATETWTTQSRLAGWNVTESLGVDDCLRHSALRWYFSRVLHDRFGAGGPGFLACLDRRRVSDIEYFVLFHVAHLFHCSWMEVLCSCEGHVGVHAVPLCIDPIWHLAQRPFSVIVSSSVGGIVHDSFALPEVSLKRPSRINYLVRPGSIGYAIMSHYALRVDSPC